MRSCPRTGAATLKWRKHRSLLGISNIIRNTPCGFQMEMQMEYSLEKNVSISSDRMVASDSVSFPRLDNPTGACPTHRRQWADFLVSLMAPLHRQYKTARTETRCHLLLKIWQMATQTSASRGYVLFDIKMAFMPSVVWCRKGHTQKS